MSREPVIVGVAQVANKDPERVVHPVALLEEASRAAFDDARTDPTSYIGAIADSFNLPQFDPRGVYPSEPLGTIGQLTPTYHGNGFWNSGALDAQSATALVQPTAKVTFAQPGTYHFACMIHPVMRGTVTVQ